MGTTEWTYDFPAVLAVAAPLFFLAVMAEWALVARGAARGRYHWRDAWTSMAMGMGNLASDVLMGAVSLGVLLWLWQFRLWDLGASPLVLVGAFIAGDFIYYWKHRAAHRIRWFWSAHVVHHSSEHYNLSTALRQPWNNHFTGHVLLSSPLVLLGLHPLVVGFVAALNLLYQFWIHTEAIGKLPKWFEAVFNTPSHHRVHHATNGVYLDRNYAGVLIVWDKLFGTFEAEDPGARDIRYGTVTPINTFNPVRVAFGELVAIARDVARPGLTLAQRAAYALAPPGWSHDGSRQTSEQLRAMDLQDIREGGREDGWQAGAATPYGTHD